MTHSSFGTILRHALCAVAVAASCASAQTMTPGTEIEGIAAIVGNEIILKSEIDYSMKQGREQYPGVPDSTLRQQLLQSLIDQKMFYAKAIEDSVQVTDDEVSQQLDYQMQQIVQGYGSEKRVEQVYGKSISQIKREYRDEVKKRILGEKWRSQKLQDQPRVTRPEVESFFTLYKDSLASQKMPVQYDCAMIAMTVKPSTVARDSALHMGRMILDSLNHGASFAELAKKYSDDPSSGANGGDLGFQKRGIFVKEFDQAVFGMKDGQTSDLVETMFGFHIIQLIERRGEEVHSRHILIKVPKTKNDEQAVIDSLSHVRQRILAGTPLAEMAKNVSDDPESKAFGGDLGPQLASTFTPEIVAALKALAPGEITQPLKSALAGGEVAYKIFQLKRVVPEHIPSLETDYKQIERIAGLYTQQKALDNLVQEVRKQVYWKVVK